MKLLHIATGGLVAAGLVAGYAYAAAAPMKFKASLTSAQEVPANSSMGKGTAEFTLDPATKELSWKVSYEGLSGDALAAHIHGPADAGANAGVEVNIGMQGLKSPMEGKATLTDAQVNDLSSGKTYVNVHTAANKGGEIRGQIMK